MNEKTLIFTMLHEDRLLASEHIPFCGNPYCLCHLDREAIQQFLILPLREGLLTPDEMARLYTGRQVC